jgi:hypothetical protein
MRWPSGATTQAEEPAADRSDEDGDHDHCPEGDGRVSNDISQPDFVAIVERDRHDRDDDDHDHRQADQPPRVSAVDLARVLVDITRHG